MDPDAVRAALNADVCSLPDAIVYGHDERIPEFEAADDPMKRCVCRNPDYLATVEAAYEADRGRFATDLGHSLALLGEDDVDTEHLATRADGLIAAGRAIDACAFNRFALFYLTGHHHQHRRCDDSEGALAIVDYARRTLALWPGNMEARLMAATAANVLGWHAEAVSLAARIVNTSMLTGGDPTRNCQGAMEFTDGLVLALRDHLRQDRPGLVCGDERMDPFARLDSGIVGFGVWSKQGARDEGERAVARLRKELYRTAYEALRNRAVATGRLADDAGEQR